MNFEDFSMFKILALLFKFQAFLSEIKCFFFAREQSMKKLLYSHLFEYLNSFLFVVNLKTNHWFSVGLKIYLNLTFSQFSQWAEPKSVELAPQTTSKQTLTAVTNSSIFQIFEWRRYSDEIKVVLSAIFFKEASLVCWTWVSSLRQNLRVQIKSK